jgi:hypothetical protein
MDAEEARLMEILLSLDCEEYLEDVKRMISRQNPPNGIVHPDKVYFSIVESSQVPHNVWRGAGCRVAAIAYAAWLRKCGFRDGDIPRNVIELVEDIKRRRWFPGGETRFDDVLSLFREEFFPLVILWR